MNSINTISPVYNRKSVTGKNTLQELPWCGKINLRGNPQNDQFVAKAQVAMEIELPLEPNTRTYNQNRTCFWLGPNEWLIYCSTEEVESILLTGRDRLNSIHHALVDVSDYYTVLQLEGPDAITLISKACPLDLHNKQFSKGSCAQTRFGHASIMVHKFSEIPTFDIQVRWSFTEYVWDYLLSGMRAL